jgi:hypothetical protein
MLTDGAFQVYTFSVPKCIKKNALMPSTSWLSAHGAQSGLVQLLTFLGQALKPALPPASRSLTVVLHVLQPPLLCGIQSTTSRPFISLLKPPSPFTPHIKLMTLKNIHHLRHYSVYSAALEPLLRPYKRKPHLHGSLHPSPPSYSSILPLFRELLPLLLSPKSLPSSSHLSDAS